MRKSTVILSAVVLSGVGFGAFFGVASSGASPTPSGSSVLYSSLVYPQPPDWWSLGFAATSATELGDKINLGSSSSQLGSATVIMDSQACENGGSAYSAPCTTTTLGSTFSVPITFTIYAPGSSAGTVGNVLATDTQTFNIPYRPSGNAADCPSGTGSTFAGTTLDGNEWFDPATGTCYYGVTYAATFNHFTFTGSRTLPNTVVYGISYTPTPSNPGTESLNVLFSTESASGDVTVGSDTDPMNLFVAASSTVNDVGGSTGEITCSTVGTTFEEYNTAVGSTGCGTDTQQSSSAPYEPIAFVPAVEIDSASYNTYPGYPGLGYRGY